MSNKFALLDRISILYKLSSCTLSSNDDSIIKDPLFSPTATKVSIGNVSLWNKNVSNKVVYANNRMYAGKYFCEGDVVEVSPVKILSDKDMYSENIRESSFGISSLRSLA